MYNTKYGKNGFNRQYSSWSEVPAIMTIEDAALLLGLHIESVRRYCVLQDIPAVQIGTQWRIDKQKLMEKFGYMD